MGTYFAESETRETVTRNFNRVRKLFALSTPKIAELIQPIAEIPYSKFRRLMGGERDISVEELNALYELLAVPPSTFTFPWAIDINSIYKKRGLKDLLFSHEARMAKNPIFDHLGTPLFPYEISGAENWLPAQLVGEALTNSEILFNLDESVRQGQYLREPQSLKYKFEDVLQKKVRDYSESLFPTQKYDAQLRALYSQYPRQSDDSLDISSIHDYLSCLGNAVLEYMRKETTFDFYRQLTEDTRDSIFLRCYDERAFKRVYDHWNYDDSCTGTLFQLVNYAGHVDFEIILRITTVSDGTQSQEEVTLIARDKEENHTLAFIDIPFAYQEWFTCTKPSEIRISGARQKTASPNSRIVIWEGKLQEELYGEGPGYRRFSYLYPAIIPNQSKLR